MRLATALTVVAMAAALPVAVGAQLHFVDDSGRMTVFEGPGVEVVEIEATARPVAEVVDAVKALCIAPGFDAAATAAAAEASGWQFKARPSKVPFKLPEYDVPIPQWAAPDAVLVSTSTRMGGAGNRFHVPGPQCNLILVPTIAVDADAVRTGFTAAFGEPSNIAGAVKKNGKPNKTYAPEWTVPAADGRPLKLMVYRSVPMRPGQADRLQIAVVPAAANAAAK